MNNSQRAKPWPCPNCSYLLGEVVYGQLYLKGEILANTDGPNLVLRCPDCGTIKTWYANDRLSGMLKEIAKEIHNQEAKLTNRG